MENGNDEESRPSAGSWVLPDLDGLAPGQYRRVIRARTPWWFAHIEAVLIIVAAAMIIVLAPTFAAVGRGLLLWELGALLAIPLGVRISMTGVAVGPSGVRLHRWWGNRDLTWSQVERFALTRSAGRFPRDRWTVHRTTGSFLVVDRINVPRWGPRSWTDPRTKAAWASVDGLIHAFNDMLAERRTAAG